MYKMHAQGSFSHMAARTFDLAVLAQSSGVEITDYIIACYYCGKYLTPHEKILYHHAALLVVWKDGIPYACCQPCVKTGARVDFLVGFTRSVTVGRIGEVTSVPWPDVLVRCLHCLRILNHTEKADIEQRGRGIYVVKGGFRSLCALCRLGI